MDLFTAAEVLAVHLIGDVVHGNLRLLSRGLDLEVRHRHVQDPIVAGKAQRSIERNRDVSTRRIGLSWGKDERTIALFVACKANAIGTPSTVGDIALDVAAE